MCAPLPVAEVQNPTTGALPGRIWCLRACLLLSPLYCRANLPQCLVDRLAYLAYPMTARNGKTECLLEG
jgi:hypothetical protein